MVERASSHRPNLLKSSSISSDKQSQNLLIKNFSSNNEVRAKAVEFIKQCVQGNLDAKTLQG